ncbi:MAG TPA: PD-(D/E)XK nuclease family protein [Thermoanaerobaculia bacterium]|nr:PD-(D/E)XK nuclease family protein [Thermoanaerobaculia bacterium]
MANPPLFHGSYAAISDALGRRLAAQLAAGDLETWLRSPVEVLLPSRGAASALSRAILTHRQGGFSGIILQTPETLARRLLNAAGHHPRVAGDAERHVAMSLAVAPSLAGVFGIASMLERSWRDVRDSGLIVSDIASKLDRLRDRRRGEAMIDSWRRCEEILRSMGSIDPADLLEKAVLRIGEGCAVARQIVFGFYDTTGMQQRFLEVLGSRNLVEEIHFPIPLESDRPAEGWEFAAPFAAWARSIAGEVASVAVPRDERFSTSIRSWSGVEEEIREIFRSIRSLLDRGVLPGEIGIVPRTIDPAESLLVRRFAREYAVPLDAPADTPLAGHRFGRALLTLFTIDESGYPRSRIIALLRDGFRGAARNRREIDHFDYATRRCSIAGGDSATLRKALPGVAVREPNLVDTIERYLIAVESIEPIGLELGGRRNGDEWAAILERILEESFGIETEDDLRAAARIDEIAGLLRRSGRSRRKVSSSLVADLIRSAEPLRIASSEPGVWLGDVMSLRGRSFAHLFAMGMQHDRFPQRRNEDPLLSDGERRAVGLPPIGDGRDEERLLFSIVRDAARERVSFSFASRDGSGRTVRPSHLLQDLMWRGESDPERRSLIYRDFSLWLGPPARADSVSAQEARRVRLRLKPEREDISPSLLRSIRLSAASGSRSSYDGYIAVDEGLRTAIIERMAAISATHLEDYGECPQKFLFRRLLRADELDDPEHEPQINPRDKGSLDHIILERFHRGADHERPLAAIAQARFRLTPSESQRLREIVDEEFDRFDRDRPPFNETIRSLERKMTHRDLERFLAHDLLELATTGYSPLHFEYSFGTNRRGEPQHPERISLDLESAAIAFHGIIDRIDFDGSRLRIVDYKSSGEQHRSLARRIEEGHRLQLALYAIAAQRIFGTTDDMVSATIKPIRTPGSKIDTFSFVLSEVRKVLFENLELFVRSVVGGAFPAFPDQEGACRFCPMRASCRTRHEPREIRAIASFRTVRDLLAERVVEAAGVDA